MGTTQETTLEMPGNSSDTDVAVAVATTGDEDATIPSLNVEPAQDDASHEFDSVFRSSSDRIKEITNALGLYCHSRDTKHKASMLAEMHGHLRQLRSELASSRLDVLAAFCGCLGRLLSSLGSNTEAANPSKLRTITNAVDFLRTTFTAHFDCREVERSPLRAMAVDDDPVCRRAMLLALGSGDLKPIICESGEKALEQLRTERVDVIFTDIMMPGVNGYELARKIRELPGYWSTPIVFVTSLSDFDARSKSILSGGCELIAKPITASELLVKAFTFALRQRITADELSPARAPASPKRNGTAPPNHLGVVYVRPDGTVQKLNQEAALLLGYSGEDLMGKTFADMFPDDLQTGPDAVTMRALFAGEFKTRRGVKVLARLKDDGVGSFAITVSQTLSSESSGYIVFLRRFESAVDPAKAPEPTLKLTVPEGETTTAPGDEALPAQGTATTPQQTSAGADENAPGDPSDAGVRLQHRVIELEQLNELADAKLKFLSCSEGELRKNLEYLKGELTSSKQLLEHARLQLSTETAARTQAEAQVQDLSERRTRLEEALAQQSRTHQETIERAEQLQARLQKAADLQACLQLAEREAAELKTAHAQGDELSAKLRSELETTAATGAELRNKCSSLEEELKASNALLAEAQQRLNEHSSLEARAQALEDEVHRLSEARERESASGRELTGIVAQEKALAEERRAAQERLEQALAEAQRNLAEECQQHRLTEDTLKKLEAATEQEKASLKAALAQAEAESGHAQQQTSGLLARIASLEQELRRGAEHLQRLNREKDESARLVAELTERERSLSEQARDLRDQLEHGRAEAGRELESEREERARARLLIDELTETLEQEKQKSLYWEQQAAKANSGLQEAQLRGAELKEQAEASQRTSADLTEQLRSAVEERDRKTAALATAEQSLAQLTLAGRETAENLRSARETVVQLNREVDLLRNELAERESTIAGLNSNSEKARAEAAELMETLAVAELDKAALQDRLIESASAAQDAKARESVLEATLAEAQKEASRLAGDLTEMRAARDLLAERCTEAERLSRELQAEIQAAQHQAQTRADRIQELELRVEDKTVALKRLQENFGSLESQLDRAAQEALAHRSQSDQEKALRQLAESRHREIAASQARLEAELAAESQARARLRQQLSIAHRRTKALEHDASLSARQRTAAERQLSDTRTELAQVQREMAAFSDRVRTSDAERAALAERLGRSEILVGEAQAARAQMEALNVELAGKAKILAERMTALESREHALEESLRQTRETMEQQAQLLDELESKAAETAVERDQCRARMESAEEEAHQLAEALEARIGLEETTRKHEEELQSALRLERDKNVELTSTIAACEASAEATQQKIRELLQMQTSLCRRIAELDKDA